MKLFNFFKKKEKSPLKVNEKKVKPIKEKPLKIVDKISKKHNKIILNEFNNSKIILPTDKRDYVDLREFIEKTRNLPSIQEQLKKIVKQKNEQ